MQRDDARALAVGRALLELVGALGLGALDVPLTYDADHLPPGVTRGAYLRRHRERMRERTPGWFRVGQARLVTREAWNAELARESARGGELPRSHLRAVGASVGDELDRALGIRTRAAR